MTEIRKSTPATTPAGAPGLAQVAAIDFTPDDPALQTAPAVEEWERLHFAVAAAAGVLSKSKEALASGDADGLLENLAATLQHAGECFGQLQAACVAAEARVYIAAVRLATKA